MKDSTALKFYEISTSWRRSEFIKKLASLFVPKCEYTNWETKVKCNKVGSPCYLPNFSEDEEEPIQWVCFEHVVDAGFCNSCHEFCAGIESFDFGTHAGYCDNCGYEIEEEERRRDDDYEYDGYFDEDLP